MLVVGFAAMADVAGKPLIPSWGGLLVLLVLGAVIFFALRQSKKKGWGK